MSDITNQNPPRSPAGQSALAGFPAALLIPMAQALGQGDGSAVIALLLADDTGYYGREWLRRNDDVLDKFLPAAYLEPLRTLRRKVEKGEWRTVPALVAGIQQVLGMNRMKYGRRSHRTLRPRLGHGRPGQTADPADRPMLIVSGDAMFMEGIDPGGRPDDAVLVPELQRVLDNTVAGLDPLSLSVFHAVQEERFWYGISGAYPSIARRLVTDLEGNPTGLRDDPEDICRPAPEKVELVRDIYIRVRQAFEKAVREAGYEAPEFRKRKHKRKGKRATCSIALQILLHAYCKSHCGQKPTKSDRK